MVAHKGELTGMLAISQYVRRSEATVLDWINGLKFPAKKVYDEYFAYVADVEAWLKDNGIERNPKPQTKRAIPRRAPRW